MAHSVCALGPNTLLSALGLWFGPSPVSPVPGEDWREARVDVLIHVNRHQPDIVYCLASLLAQDRPPGRVILVDDGGAERDHTVQIAREFARVNGLALVVVERVWSMGWAATLKRQARELDGDVLFVLDGNVVLESPDYITRCVQTLYEGAGTASVRGLHRPSRPADRVRWAGTESFRHWVAGDVYRDPRQPGGRIGRALHWLSTSARECTAMFQQRFLDRGQMALFGGVGAPTFTATAYRRRYLKDMFDRYEPLYGDRLTARPDLFIAMALCHEGYHNSQVADVVAHAPAPGPHALPVEHHGATAAFLQGCHAFDALLRTPVKWPRYWWHQRSPEARRRQEDMRNARRVVEAYRQPFGERLTQRHGRPVGWVLFFAVLEKLAMPAAVLALAFMAAWGWLLALLLIDAAVWLAVLWAVTRREDRLVMLGKGVASLPLRHGLQWTDLFSVLVLPWRWPRKALVRPA
ncbi:glycosyltransferase [Lysobacter sp. SG-8]|uniref:Glycosyltransferase n=1 Tax=Marilutibacter penaei TaxID=2759900 RepID=A0A7W3YEW2_9GAMM|nr:glycosyltransferase [Lysobacter penaei]MBB1088863.1 glycosyltransferase [Lysobacter penaei]